MTPTIEKYEPNIQCSGCEKDTECVVIRTEAWTAPHCAKCLMREMRKRAKGQPQNGQTNG